LIKRQVYSNGCYSPIKDRKISELFNGEYSAIRKLISVRLICMSDAPHAQ